MAKRKKPSTEDSTVTASGQAPAPLRIEGELTIYTAAETKERIVGALAAGSALEIDLSQVGEIDTAGLQLLILAKREAAARGASVALIHHSSAVLECFELCNMTAVLGAAADNAAGAAPTAQE